MGQAVEFISPKIVHLDMKYLRESELSVRFVTLEENYESETRERLVVYYELDLALGTI